MQNISKVLDHFNKLIDGYAQVEEFHRASSFRRASDVIKDLEELPENLGELGKLPGIGPSTIKEVKEVLESGTSKRLTELTQRIQESGEVQKKTDESIDKLRALLKNKAPK